MPPPPVLQRLRALGLTQERQADYLGVTQAAVSQWMSGRRQFEEPWRSEAEALLAVLSEHLAQGKPLDTFVFLPAFFLNRGGVTSTGEGAPLTQSDFDELTKLQHELAALPPDRWAVGMYTWQVHRTAHYLADLLVTTPLDTASAAELDTMRRMVLSLHRGMAAVMHVKAQRALEGHDDA